MSIDKIKAKVNNSVYEDKPFAWWHEQLSIECEVYVYGEAYLAKRFDHIQYSFVDKDVAKEILVDNLYALLRFKYFENRDDDVDSRIKQIIQSFTDNLKTTLLRVAFEWEAQKVHKTIKQIPNYSLAFRNGVYDFLNDKWLLKYETTLMSNNANLMYTYDNSYIITWYIDIDFEPLPFSIMNTNFKEFVEIMKVMTKEKGSKNYAFELLYNMSHDITHRFSFKRLEHLSEILGYSLLQQFTQNFVFLMGSGQNGKNSLFDGCLIPFLVPKPASNSLDAIENDRFITGALQNKYHNIFLETEAKTYTQSMMIKALTGSMYQTVESKGTNKYSAILNLKYIFAGNDQDKIKFRDTTQGFRRRINIYEVWYRWDKKGQYLKQGSYYDVSFSGDLREFKNDIANTIIYIYMGMYGLLSATRNFVRDFDFTHNEWKTSLGDIDLSLRSTLSNITLKDIYTYANRNKESMNECRALFYSEDGKRLYRSGQYYKVFDNSEYEDMLEKLLDKDFVRVADDKNLFINLKTLKSIIGDLTPQSLFTQNIRRLYNIDNLPSFYNNQPYLEITLNGDKIVPLTLS
jgi:hypothetical protein